MAANFIGKADHFGIGLFTLLIWKKDRSCKKKWFLTALNLKTK